MNFVKFIRTTFSQNTSGPLLLSVMLYFVGKNGWVSHEKRATYSRHNVDPVDTLRRFNVCKTSRRRRRRLIDVETMSCIYGVSG